MIVAVVVDSVVAVVAVAVADSVVVSEVSIYMSIKSFILTRS